MSAATASRPHHSMTSSTSHRRRNPYYPPPSYAAQYKVESFSRDGVPTEVIVIEDSPPPGASDTASTSTYRSNGAAGVVDSSATTGKEPPFDPYGSRNDGEPAAKRARKGLVDGYSAYDQNGRRAAPVEPTTYEVNNARYVAASKPAVAPRTKAGGSNKRKLDAYDTNNYYEGGSVRDSYGSVSQPHTHRAKEQKLPPCDDKEGHFIVRPDEDLGSRYKILRLLGQGTFGKVVECYDRDTRTHVAIKIIRAVPKYRDASKVEIKVLTLLRERDPENVHKCIHLIHCFDYRNHICIVSELLSSSVFDFLKDNGYTPFPASHIQSFAKQLLSSVAFLHELRLIHTDLKPENILLVDNSYRTVTSKRAAARSRKILNSSELRLIDFGSATFEEDYHASVVSTRHYRAPEIILGLGWSYPCDVWSIGCMLVEFFTGQALFQTHENLEHLAMMEAVFGPMPDRFARHASRSKPAFFRGTRVDFPNSSTSSQSRKFVKAMRPLEETIPKTTIVQSRFLDLLKKLLTWDPAQRITVREALRHPFFALKIEDEGSEFL